MNLLFGLVLVLCLSFGEPKEMLPGVWVDEGTVEINASVAMDCHHPETPDVYLEMLITSPDTREHESLLVSMVKPANLHAGLLAAGFEPGKPVSFVDGERVSATGDGVIVEVRVEDSEDWVGLVEWVSHVENGTDLTEDTGWDGLVFAGSVLIGDGQYGQYGQYKADREGALVSLTPWGFEVISPAWVVSPDASVDEPVWIANREVVPKIGVKVRVRFRKVETESELDSDD
ncbi:MAG: hypothetical protein JKY43_03875 [Phycisphaerales bacterium]|nr:hypothetical protein [Phycisphaerales bacterium]